METNQLFSHTYARRVLRRAGYSDEQIDDVLRQVPDPIDSVRDADVLFKLGVSISALVDRMGGSP